MVTEHVNLFYGTHQALKDVSLVIRSQEITAIVGPSGCGKSSFLRCLNRMNDIVSTAQVEGRILLSGMDVYGRGVDVVDLRRRVGMVFQRPNPFPCSIYDNITYGPRIHGIRRRSELDAIVERSLKSAALWDEVKDNLKQSAVSLSGGQQQRLCIARCLAVNPEVILLDEPCSALDPISTYRIEDLLQTLKEKYTIVLVTHNLFQAARVADTTCFFLAGQLVEHGPTPQIFENPKDSRTEDFVRGRFG